jgi:hypothetical protein
MCFFTSLLLVTVLSQAGQEWGWFDRFNKMYLQVMGSSITAGNVLEEIPEDMAEYLASLEMVPSVLFMPYTMPVEDDNQMYIKINHYEIYQGYSLFLGLYPRDPVA